MGEGSSTKTVLGLAALGAAAYGFYRVHNMTDEEYAEFLNEVQRKFQSAKDAVQEYFYPSESEEEAPKPEPKPKRKRSKRKSKAWRTAEKLVQKRRSSRSKASKAFRQAEKLIVTPADDMSDDGLPSNWDAEDRSILAQLAGEWSSSDKVVEETETDERNVPRASKIRVVRDSNWSPKSPSPRST